MKKAIAILATVATASALNAFGQGYFEFTSGSRAVYDNFTTPGTGTAAPGDVTTAFLWTSTGASDLLSGGLATTGSASGSGGYTDISTMLQDGWNIGYVYNGGNPSTTEADVAVHASGPTIGGIGYGTFQLNGVGLGATVSVVVVGWDNLTGVGTLESAISGGTSPLGWSNEFSYTTGASSSSPIDTVTVAGMTPFGVAPVPEPATLALAGIGGLSMLFLRRRKA